MSDAPIALTRHEISEQLDRLYGGGVERRMLVAFHGRGQEESVTTRQAGTFRVIPVRSELELRERMPRLDDEEARIAFLVPWAADLPLDLAGRFSGDGRVRRIGKHARLQRLFGVGEIDTDAAADPLAGHLLDSGIAALPTRAGRVTRAVMYDAWLAHAWRIDTASGLGLEALMAWAALDQRGPATAEAMKATPVVREALLAYLLEKRGPAAPVVWRSWESGRGRDVLELALLFEILASSEHAGVRMWVKLAARSALQVSTETDIPAVVTALAEAASGALMRVQNQPGDEGFARAVLRAADARLDDPDVREAASSDRRLPSAWRRRLDCFGEALLVGAQAPGVAATDKARAAHTALTGHAFFADRDQTTTVERGEMALRLLAWLSTRSDTALEGAPTPYAHAELLGRWYVAEGGFVDRARRGARGSATDTFGKGVQAVVEEADRARLDLDRRFARSLQAWNEAMRPATQVLPIDVAVKRIAAAFLEEDPSRQLLVLLLDGMAWAQAVEILESLGERTIPWGPVAWHRSSKGKIGEAVYPVVFANLPTVTEVSRAAFFGGKPLAPGAATDTSKDVDRWRDHAEVKKLFDGPEVPRLLLRGEGHTQSGSASQEALTLVSDRARRVVAIVINAIDASLKGDPQQRHTWTVDSIRPLADLLDRAREAKRAVLLASDHGHVPADLLSPRPAVARGGARWRPWSSSSGALDPSELVFQGPHVWSPRGADGVVLLADDRSRYGGAAHAGEHGGATLAEVVAPCVLIGCEELTGPPAEDRGLAVCAAHVPGWWHFDVLPAAPPIEVVVPEPPRVPRKAVDERQLPLPAIEPPVAPPKAVPPARAQSAFAESPILGALAPSAVLKRSVVTAVEFLLERHGVASAPAFATAMGLQPWRVGGFVARLQEVLNVEGYQILRYDPDNGQIHLDREKLAQQFEVTL